MSSELKTNKISPATGTALQIGDSGDTITIPSGATLTNSGTATGFGDEAQYFFASMTGSNQAVSDNTSTKVTINNAILDNKSGFDTTNYKFVVPSDGAGIWRIGGQVNGYQRVGAYLLRVFAMLYKNGSSLGDPYDSLHDIGGAFGLDNTTKSVSAIVSLSAGDYIELYGKVARASGSGQNDILQRGTNFYGFRIKAT